MISCTRRWGRSIRRSRNDTRRYKNQLRFGSRARIVVPEQAIDIWDLAQEPRNEWIARFDWRAVLGQIEQRGLTVPNGKSAVQGQGLYLRFLDYGGKRVLFYPPFPF